MKVVACNPALGNRQGPTRGIADPENANPNVKALRAATTHGDRAVPAVRAAARRASQVVGYDKHHRHSSMLADGRILATPINTREAGGIWSRHGL